MGITYKSASASLLEVGHRLIEQNHGHLVKNEVRVDFRHSDAWFSKYSVSMPGVAHRLTNLPAHMSNDNEPYFVVAVCVLWWETATERDREAEVDKCLCMCGSDIDEDGGVKTYLVGPDCVIWRSNHERFGAHELDLKAMAPTHFKQLDLFGLETTDSNAAAPYEGLTDEERQTAERLISGDRGVSGSPGGDDDEDEEVAATPAHVTAYLGRHAGGDDSSSGIGDRNDTETPDIISAHAGGGNPLTIVHAEAAVANGANGNGTGKRSRRAAAAASHLGEGAESGAEGEKVAA